MSYQQYRNNFFEVIRFEQTLMNSLCNHNPILAPATQMARGDYFVTRPSVVAWGGMFETGALFILNRKQNVDNSRHGCRKRFPLIT